jgi:N-acyl-D-amino-acid deacylase
VTFDVLIRNATIVDGTGAPRFPGDIGIRSGRIERIGELSGERGTTEIDLEGRVAAPGFIDAHTHDDRLMLSVPDMAPKVSQGITTVVAGNCGISLAPMPRPIPQPVTPPLNLLDDEGGWFRFRSFASYVAALRARPAATNCALLVGHTTLRVATLDDLQRPASAAEVARMRVLVEEALDAGAIGVSTGLFYEPAIAAPTEEVIETCRPLKPHGGIYCTHMRDEEAGIIDSLTEAFRIGREVGVPVVVSHLKVVGPANHGRSAEALAFIEKHMARQPICMDCYPYTAGSTVLSAHRAASSARVIVSWSKALPQYAGRDLENVAREMGVSRDAAIARLLPAGGIYFRLDEADVQRILRHDNTMIGSDGLPHDVHPHPRLWGTFPRVLGHYCREVGLFGLETAVRKMTGLPASRFGLSGRGIVAEGAYADLAVFDPQTVIDRATFAEPTLPAAGISHVFVNGRPVWSDGKPSGERAGRALRRQRMQAETRPTRAS